jgi:hypothetical protein
VNAVARTVCPLPVTSDPATMGVFRDGIEEEAELKVHARRSCDVDAKILHSYLRGVLIPMIEDYQEAKDIPDAFAVLLMDNCSAHLKHDTIQLLSVNKVKNVAFQLIYQE